MSTNGRRAATALAVVVLLAVIAAVLVRTLTAPAATVDPAASTSSSSAGPSPTTSGPPATPSPSPTASAPAPAPSATPTVTSDAPSDVTVTTTFSGVDPSSGAVVVGAYVDVLESGGTCTLTLTSTDGATASVKGNAVPDASTTSCGDLTVPSTSVSSGTWQAVVDYSSPAHRGASAPVTVVVP